MPIVTLDSMKKKNAKEDEDEDEGGGNEYFTGGTGAQGQGSGLAVISPGDRRPGGDDPMRQLIEKITREQGRGPSQQPSGSSSSAARGAGRRIVAVTAYRNGFTVDKGPLRTLDEAQNKLFMESLIQGYCPDELVENGQPADVQLENKMSEDYKELSQPRFNAFGGAGAQVGEISLSAGTVINPGTEGSNALFVLDETQKDIVKVQIKFPDGKKEIAKFNKQHTVRALIAKIEELRPNLTRYQMLSGDRGPPKPVDPQLYDQTISAAGLAGALVTIKECN